MTDEIIACLDGSRKSEAILPLAQGIAKAKRAPLTVLRVVGDAEEISAEESYLRELVSLYGARVKFIVAADPADAIIDELGKNPRALAAMTTHGRSAWIEAIIGSVALKVVREAMRPVLLFRPYAEGPDAPRFVSTIVIALDGSELSEKIIPFTVELAKSTKAEITLAQAVPATGKPAARGAPEQDILESSYLRSTAGRIACDYGITASWETLHGDPGEALCRYVRGVRGCLLAMTSHSRGVARRSLVGSVAAYCIRNAEVPILLYWRER